jgi:hypothetical protein
MKSRDEIETEILRLQDELDDLEEAVRFEYTYTTAHIGGRQVRRDEENLTLLRSRIADLQALLSRTEVADQ